MQSPKIGKTNRQLTIRPFAFPKHETMARTIHGFDRHLTAFELGKIHVFLEMIQVTGTLPQVNVQNLGRNHFLITMNAVQTTQIISDQPVNQGSFGIEKRRSRSLWMKTKKLKLFTQLAM